MTDKPKPRFRDVNTGAPKDTFMPPETMGKMKGPSVWDMSLDELIEYRSTGNKPKRILDVDVIYALAKTGVSIENICGLFSYSRESFCNNDAFLTAHRNGRSECGIRIRASIVEHARNGSLDAAKYLDRITGGDIIQENVNLSISQRPLDQTPADNLLEVIYRENGDKDS